MNTFYTYSKRKQWTITIILLIIFGVLMIAWLQLMTRSLWYYFSIVLLVPPMQFALTPLLTLTGTYKYLSPMLLVYNPTQEKYDLHNGTAFDYFFVMRGIKKGRATQNKILAYYLEGLLKIVEELEQSDIPESITISGTSYFFSESTARRLGFSIDPPNRFLQFNQYINYVDLVWMYSRAKGRFRLPNLKNVKSVSIKGSGLLAQKESLQKLYAYILSRQQTVVKAANS